MTGPVTGPEPAPVTGPVSGPSTPEPGTPLAVLVCRAGGLPPGADEAVAEAGGEAVVVGEGAYRAAAELVAARRAWTIETPPGLRVAALTERLCPLLAASPLVVLPASADGRDLAPRLAAALDRPLLAGATRVGLAQAPGGVTEAVAVLARLDDRLALPVRVPAPALATMPPGVRSVTPLGGPPQLLELPPLDADGGRDGRVRDVEVLEVLQADAATMDLAEASRVVAGGAGLLPAGAGDEQGRAVFEVLSRVAAALGASTGATRVVTDAGWLGTDRQIGTTGITLDPDLYLAFGISGAVQHVGGIGNPAHVVSVNTDASCPMTTMATLGLVTDARALLAELARRLGVEVPEAAGLPTSGQPTSAEVPA